MAFNWIWKRLKSDDKLVPPPPPLASQLRKQSNAGGRDSSDVIRRRATSFSSIPSTIPTIKTRELRRRSTKESISNHSTPWGTPSETLETEGPTLLALNDYERTDEDLRKGEQLKGLNETSERYATGIEAEPWYFGDITRIDTERRLLSNENDHGSFIIRKAQSRKDEYSLSVRDMSEVFHYRIRPKDHGGFFIKRRDNFPSLQELIDYYSKDAHGLCTRLNKPCIMIETPTTQGLSHDTWDVWEVQKEQVELVRELGSGQFGQVYEGLWNKTVPVAVKTLRRGKMNPHDFLEEAQILKNLRHPKLLQLYAVSTQEEPFYIITELMRNGSLLDYLRSRLKEPLPLLDQVHVGTQVADGMEYLESKNYIHRDLAARNVLVGEDGTVKVADFGLSRLVKEDEYLAQEGVRIPIKWTAPEALRYSKFTTKSDVWSFGVLLMEVVTSGSIPYPSMNNVEVTDAVERGYRMPKPATCPTKLYNLMLLCWAKSPSSRPTFERLHRELDNFFAVEETETDYRDIDYR